MKKRIHLAIILIASIAILAPVCASAGGLFDGTLPTPAPTARPTPTAEPAPIPSEAVASAEGARILRFENVSYAEVLEILAEQSPDGLARIEYDAAGRELVLYYAESAPASSAEPTAAPKSDADLLLELGLCRYCGGLGDCGECINGECMTCWGEGTTFCSTCGGWGDCRACDGMGGEMIYVFGGDNKWVTCSVCRGSKKCGTCKGSGEQKCGSCRGSGKCNTCKGTDVCSYCGGSGKA